MDSQKLEEQLTEIKTMIWQLAKECQGENLAILSILRSLEQLHREIREQLFEPSLPNRRNTLYNLIKDMEETGGWPYIERMKLQDILLKLGEKKPSSDIAENK